MNSRSIAKPRMASGYSTSTLWLKRLTAIACITLIVSGCSTVPTNTPLSPESLRNDGEFISTGGYRFAALQDDTAHSILFLLSISGGGKRSAAFGYGILKGLRDFDVEVNGQQRRLLDELDIVTAVSGGSFPAAYYGLHRDKIFSDFETDFLRQDIESYIWGSFLLPWTIGVRTNERMARVYDHLMFRGATFADLLRKGRPLVSVNATDVSYGLVFPFTQDYFDLICSDLSTIPLARAVAASNGFPVLFKPITLKSYAERCGGRIPAWTRREAGAPELTRGRQLAEDARRYVDPVATRYVHLMDGGISDNLAMRSMVNAMVVLAADGTVLREANISAVRRILLISADGESSNTGDGAKQAEVSRIGQVFSAVTGTEIDRYNFETLTLAQSQLQELRDSVRALRCRSGPVIDGQACDDVEATFIHLSLAEISNAKERDHLERIPTRLTLKDDDVDQLIEAGASVVRESRPLQQFRARMNASNAFESAEHAGS